MDYARFSPLVLALGLALPACGRTHAGTSKTTSVAVPVDPARDPGSPAATCQEVTEGFGPVGATPVRAELVVRDLEVPWGIAFLPNGDLLVTERPGRVRLVRGGVLQRDPVARVPTAASGESGLLGIALHPDFASTRTFFLYFTVEKAADPVNRIERWRLDESGTHASLDRVILDDIPSYGRHDGGRLRIGPDRMLYVGTGDAADPKRSAQIESLAGKVLRLTLDGAPAPGNPWNNAAYVRGVRNTQAFDWLDASTMIIADHGPSGEMGRKGHDEIDVARAGTDLGWPATYGCATAPNATAPLLTWTEAVPPGGAAIYTGDAIPAWKGSLLVGTLASKHLHRVVLDPTRTRVTMHEAYFDGDPPDGLGRLRDVVMGPDAQLYVTTSNCDGRGHCPEGRDAIYRILSK